MTERNLNRRTLLASIAGLLAWGKLLGSEPASIFDLSADVLDEAVRTGRIVLTCSPAKIVLEKPLRAVPLRQCIVLRNIPETTIEKLVCEGVWGDLGRWPEAQKEWTAALPRSVLE